MKKNTNVMACGCAVVMEQDGKMVSSVDRLVSFMSSLLDRSESRQAQGNAAAARA